MKTRKTKAFTLIELLVVISIIALLLSILMPSLSMVKKQSRTLVCQTKNRQWGIMFELYAADNDDKFCPSWTPANWDKDWHDYLRLYSELDYDIMLCPEATKIANCQWFPAELRENAVWPRAAWVDATNYQPGDKPIEDYDYGSYTYNSWATSIPENDDSGYLDYAKKLLSSNCWIKTSNIFNRNNVPLITDGKWPSTWVDDTNYPPAYPLNEIPWANVDNNIERVCSDRHYGYIAAVFADGSSRKVGIKELWRLKWHRSFNIRNDWAVNQGERNWPEWMSEFKNY